LNILLGPRAIDHPPHPAIGILVLERGWQAMETHVVEALEHGETP
jgi:hypothetical protein